MNWEIVIGLETHAQLSTASKIFSGASTAFGAAPNTQACAVDIALPGVLPVLNRGAVERAIRFGLAVGATINRRSVFARKNYFYPDLPKGYQISQYEMPVVPAARSRSFRRRAARSSVRAHPRASRGGRGQVAARGLPRHDRHRPQPRRHAAARDRLGARHAQLRRGGRLCQDAARAGALDRHLRRQHAGRLLPLRRQRLGATRGRREARHALRDQEPQLLPLPRAGDRVRGAAPDRAHRGRRHRRPGNAPLRPGPRRDALDAQQGRRARLSLLSRSRPAAARDRRGLDRARAASRCPSCPRR